MTQSKWDKRFLKLAKEVSTWSKDPGRKIGSVIVGQQNQVISQGYNSFPRGIEDCEERYTDKETKLKYVVHAEANAIYNALHSGAHINGSSIYIHGLPCCHECAKAVIQTGIKTVIMDSDPHKITGKWAESGLLALEMFEECEDIEVKIIEDL